VITSEMLPIRQENGIIFHPTTHIPCAPKELNRIDGVDFAHPKGTLERAHALRG
jgi:hypothetical protein